MAARKEGGIGIREVKEIRFTTSDGQPIKEGDMIVIGIKGQDVVCTFGGLDGNGYFQTRPIYTGSEVKKYRPGSVEACYLVKAFEIDKQQPQEEAAAEAGQEAAAPTLQPAS